MLVSPLSLSLSLHLIIMFAIIKISRKAASAAVHTMEGKIISDIMKYKLILRLLWAVGELRRGKSNVSIPAAGSVTRSPGPARFAYL